MRTNRRRYLASLAGIGSFGLAGCTDSVALFGDDTTALGPPETSRGSPIHPIHGDEFPDFELPDPATGQAVSLNDLGGTAFAMTFIYTSCTDQCGVLMQLLRLIQNDAAEMGYSDDIELLAVTFDPDTDTPEKLIEYAEVFGIDPDSENFRFLRPEDNDTAHEIVNERFGVPAEVHDDHHDHDGSDDHEYGDSDGNEEPQGTGIHYYMLFLVNGDGIVERSYPNVVGSREETRPNAILEDVQAVVGI